VIATFAALAEPNRLRIVELLHAGPLAVGAIGESLRLNQPQVSKHLRVLKEARLVEVKPLAQQRVYELRPEPMRELRAWLERYRDLWEERFDQLDQLLEKLKQEEAQVSLRSQAGPEKPRKSEKSPKKK
jgi:DNA-binding transcriptional ArsR family regulator